MGYGSKGDFLLDIKIKIPKVENDDDRKLLEKMRKKSIFN